MTMHRCWPGSKVSGRNKSINSLPLWVLSAFLESGRLSVTTSSPLPCSLRINVLGASDILESSLEKLFVVLPELRRLPAQAGPDAIERDGQLHQSQSARGLLQNFERLGAGLFDLDYLGPPGCQGFDWRRER